MTGVEHDCTIYDRSKTGMRLNNYGDIELPSTFIVRMKSDETMTGWLIWQSEGEAGLSFTAPLN